jgi:hypothetical protein
MSISLERNRWSCLNSQQKQVPLFFSSSPAPFFYGVIATGQSQKWNALALLSLIKIVFLLLFHPSLFLFIMLHEIGGLLVLATMAVAQQACNGDPTLCSMPYNQVSYLTTHNSYAYTSNVGQNQHYNIRTQLNDGVRGLKLSALKSQNYTGVELCHSSCGLLDAGTAHDTLNIIADWLKNNPNEVVTIMWNNGGNFQATDLQAEYQQASGINDYLFVQPQSNWTWPTLSDMISSGKRLVSFMDVGADQNNVSW